MMRGQWGRAADTPPTGFRARLSDSVTRRLLLIALMNAAPGGGVLHGLHLLRGQRSGCRRLGRGALDPLFPRRCGTIPIWSRLAARYGERPVLLVAMAAAIATFSVVLTLEAGDVGIFAVICFMSGAVIGADFAILPALFARRMADIAPEAGAAFGLWAFVQKAALGAGGGDDAARAGRGGIFCDGGPGKFGGGVAIADMALCFGAMHPETRGDGAACDDAAAGPATGHGLTRGRPMREWSGKRYWLVGASEGLGKALAQRLSRCGAEVIVSARSEEKLKAVVAELPGRASYVPSTSPTVTASRRRSRRWARSTAWCSSPGSRRS
jgi:hypothetical protein